MQELTEADRMFRTFQIQKFDTKRLIPAVSMSVSADVTKLMELRKQANERRGKERRVTVTHVALKAACDTIMDFPVLYSSFNGKRVVENPELVLNVPVDVESHVEYLVIRDPASMTFAEFIDVCYDELEKIQRGEGEFRKKVEFIVKVPFFIRKLVMKFPSQQIKFLRKHYGNFVVSNFGSIGADAGTLASAQPMIAVLCMGRIASTPVEKEGGYEFKPMLPLAMTFDHRPVDGGYVGRYLAALKALLEAPEPVFESVL
ncbi:MAG: 2-oxo acid dehydrogenase subunit E2 [Planctomycetes bacterium]|nr:2-oxo acid dehydrogenase subunit E2 [Planctomycetota bacterium]